MSWETIKKLHEERTQLAMEMRKLVEEAGAKGETLDDDQQARFDKMHEDLERKDKMRDNLEKAREADLQSAENQEAIARASHELDKRARKDTDVATADDALNAFRCWAIGPQRATDEQRAAAKKVAMFRGDNVNLRLKPMHELRQMAKDLTYRATTAQTITTSGGGYTIETEMVNRIEEALLFHGGMRSVATVLRTQSGGTLNHPTADDSSNKATILAINSAAAGKDITFGQVALSAYKYTSGIVLVPMELMQDEAVNLVQYIGSALGTRVARGTNEHFTVGESTNTQPDGAIAQATAGVAATTGTVLTYSRILDLEHSVDIDYRGNASWMAHDTVVKNIWQLVDSNGVPLWQPSVQLGVPDALLRYPVVTNNDMVATTTTKNAKNLAFGDFSKYLIRDVQDIEFLRLEERYAEKAQVAFLTFSRHDGATLIAGTTSNRPISVLLGEAT
jgi:HK97 family phage major capsid protein